MQELKNFFHLLEAIAANIYFGFPSRKLTVIGVTGTDGKTTTSHLIYHILKNEGIKAGLISSIHAIVAGKTIDTGFHTTTPRPWDIQQLLKKAVDSGITHFVLETTSHALDQNRVWGIHYAVSVLTNISHEHLHYHRTFDEYIRAKLLLLQRSDLALINKDHDLSFKKIVPYLDEKKIPYKSYSVDNKHSDFFWQEKKEIPLDGEFNHQNAMAAYAVCFELGIDHKRIIDSIFSFILPTGRFDIICTKPFTVIVDFAHTPAAIEHVLELIAGKYAKSLGRIIHVFGAASERDDQKRAPMGEASGMYASIVILTEEDYRNENVHMICEAIAVGLQKKGLAYVQPNQLANKTAKKVYTIVPDREKAIQLAVSIAQKGDVILATGKSHEKSLNRGGVEHDWNEYAAFRSALKTHDQNR